MGWRWLEYGKGLQLLVSCLYSNPQQAICCTGIDDNSEDVSAVIS